MRHQGDTHIQERLIGDTLSEYLDRVNAWRDLWPEIRDRAPLWKRAAFPPLLKALAAVAAVSLIVVAAVVQPWSPSDPASHFMAVAQAYDGLFDLETVRYRVDGTNSSGQEFVQHHQVDMVNRIEHSVTQMVAGLVLGPSVGDAFRQEFLKIDGKHYIRRSSAAFEDFAPEQWVSESSSGGWALFPDPMRQPKEGYPWAPFGKFGGLPWSRESGEESFDKIDLVGDTEIDGQPVVHYRASRRSAPKHESVPHPMVSYMDGKRLENVHRGVEDYLATIDTVDFWVTQDGSRFIKADWTHIERGPPLPADFKERDWCEGLGEFNKPAYTYRVTDGSGNRSYFSGDYYENYYGMDRDSHDLAEVICWNQEETEGRMVWGRTIPEVTGEDFWVRWVYTFTAFNEPLSLPEDLP